MKKTFLILAALLCCCFALKAQEQQNYDFLAQCPSGQTLYYRIIDAEQHLVSIVAPNGDNAFGWDGYTKPTGNITLPETVNNNRTTYTVTVIGDCAFYNCRDLKGSLTIPNSVKNIGIFAFSNCSGFTGSLTIGSSVENIGKGAFAWCSGFTGSLTIGSSVENIGDGAFYECFGFTQIIAKPATPPGLGLYVFDGATRLQSVIVPCGSVDDYKNAEEWSTFAEMIEGRFFDHDLTVASANPELGTASITTYPDCENFEATVTATPTANCLFTGWTENNVVVSTDNPYTFTLTNDRNLVANFFRNYDFSADCSTGQTLYYRIIDEEQHTVSIVAPNSDDVFGWDGFTKPTGEITLPETVEYDGTNYTVTAIGDQAFRSCYGLTGTLAIPNSVTSIGNDAFFRCENISSLTIGSSVTSIGADAFWECHGLTGSLTIPNSVESIGEYAFNDLGCDGTLTIGNAVTSIGKSAFAHSKFTHIIAKPTTPPALGDNAFSDMTKLETITVPCDLDIAYKASWSVVANKIEDGFVYDLTVASSNPDFGSASITQQADCENAQATVTAMSNGNHVFGGWTENGEMVSTDNPYTFTMTSDRNLVANFFKQYDFSAICSTGQTLYYRIINAEQHWVSIVAPNSDNANAWNGFAKPTGDIILPENVEYNGTNYTVRAIGNCAFYHCDGLTGSLTIPNSVTSIEGSAFVWCSGFTGSLTIGDSVTSIGGYAFYECHGLTGTLTIGSSVESIGSMAFF